MIEVAAQEQEEKSALLSVQNLVVEYGLPGGKSVKAVSNLTLEVNRGETLGLVGESGCGKSSTGQAVMMLRPPSSGKVIFDGADITGLRGRALRALRPRMQMIFQDPISSLNPRRRIRDIVAEGLYVSKAPKPWADQVDAALLAVGLDPVTVGNRRPRELSGGQCQRVAIARALLLEPELVVCDEPVSALDVSVQAQIIGILAEMRERYSLTLLFIAHDLAVVKNVSDRVAVMYLGKIVEVARSDDLYLSPCHPYTTALLSAIPIPDPHVEEQPLDLYGELPSPINPPSGCRFRTRCPRAAEVCAAVEPELKTVADGHLAACHFPNA